MNFLSNENFPFPSVQILRDTGYSVLSITEEYPGITDNEVLKIATAKKLIILTFDKDYEELIFKQKIKTHPSVVFFRYKGVNPRFAALHLRSKKDFFR